jgi:hypothetical protein
MYLGTIRFHPLHSPLFGPMSFYISHLIVNPMLGLRHSCFFSMWVGVKLDSMTFVFNVVCSLLPSPCVNLVWLEHVASRSSSVRHYKGLKSSKSFMIWLRLASTTQVVCIDLSSCVSYVCFFDLHWMIMGTCLLDYFIGYFGVEGAMLRVNLCCLCSLPRFAF